MNDIKKIIATNVKKYRKSLNLSQEKLSEQINIDNGTISRIERGVQFPNYNTFVKLIEFFKIKPYQLLIEETEPFDREAYIEAVYPLIMNDIKKRLNSTEIPINEQI